jgi:hypothetical protein
MESFTTVSPRRRVVSDAQTLARGEFESGMKKEVIPRPPLVRVTLDARRRIWLAAFLREVFGYAPSGKVIMNANDGGVLHMELEGKPSRTNQS